METENDIGAHTTAAGVSATPTSSLSKKMLYLQNAEQALLEHRKLAVAGEAKIGPTKITEFGTVIFLLNHPDHARDPELRAALDAFKALLKKNGVVVPPSRLSEAEYASLASTPSLEPDGTVVGTGTYQAHDPMWSLAAVNDAMTDELGAYYGSGNPLELPPTTYTPVVASGRSGDQCITFGLISDWGAGNPGNFPYAVNAMNALGGQNPDYMIHLGDVYYAGTPSAQPPNAGKYERFYYLGEEQANFLELWPPAMAGRSFAMNSNHEMYTGAWGLLGDVLTGNGPFSAQGTNTVFAISVGDWTILGLDTAYDTPYDLYMYGQISAAQQAWIQNLGLDNTKTIVLSHHTGLDYDGGYQSSSDAIDSYQSLWSAISAALGGDPYAWYWGHVHNGIAYNKGTEEVTVPTSTTSSRTSATYCRCLGYAAIPFASAPGLAGSSLPWFVQDGTAADPAYNGFATLQFELNTSNQVTSITESFWDCNPNSKGPLWSNPLYAPAG